MPTPVHSKDMHFIAAVLVQPEAARLLCSAVRIKTLSR